MSQSYFDEYNLKRKDLTVPFAGDNIFFKSVPKDRNNTYPKGLGVHEITIGVVQSADTRMKDGLPFAPGGSLVQLSGLRTPSVDSIGLLWGVTNTLVPMSGERGVEMKTNTELLMELDTYDDGVRKAQAQPRDPNWKMKEAYASWATNIQRANLLAQNQQYKKEGEALARDAWDELDIHAPLIAEKMRNDARKRKDEELRRREEAVKRKEEGVMSPREEDAAKQQSVEVQKELQELKNTGAVKEKAKKLKDLTMQSPKDLEMKDLNEIFTSYNPEQKETFDSEKEKKYIEFLTDQKIDWFFDFTESSKKAIFDELTKMDKKTKTTFSELQTDKGRTDRLERAMKNVALKIPEGTKGRVKKTKSL